MLTGMVHTVSTLCRTRKEQAERVSQCYILYRHIGGGERRGARYVNRHGAYCVYTLQDAQGTGRTGESVLYTV